MPKNGKNSKPGKTLEERRKELQKVNREDVADLYRYHHSIQEETTPPSMKTLPPAAMIEAILTREFPSG